MPVKFWHTSLRFWFFLSYLITTEIWSHPQKGWKVEGQEFCTLFLRKRPNWKFFPRLSQLLTPSSVFYEYYRFDLTPLWVINYHACFYFTSSFIVCFSLLIEFRSWWYLCHCLIVQEDWERERNFISV